MAEATVVAVGVLPEGMLPLYEVNSALTQEMELIQLLIQTRRQLRVSVSDPSRFFPLQTAAAGGRPISCRRLDFYRVESVIKTRNGWSKPWDMA